MIPFITLCSRCLATGRSVIILKRKQYHGHGSSLSERLEYRRKGFTQRSSREAGKKMFRAMTKHSIAGKNVFQILTGKFLKVQKKIISGKWAKPDPAVPAPKSISI